jgi:aspartyl-tRNA(Asn)/glutamyl-tRNA(Gln) amidotransferase subunit A
MSGAFLTAEDYVQAQRCRTQIIGAVNDAFKDVDVLLTANAMEPACRIDDEDSINRTYSRQARSPFNLTGHPALAMMSGLSKSGLPLSVQLVGRYFDEVTLLRVAQAYERAAEWTKRRPPV